MGFSLKKAVKKVTKSVTSWAKSPVTILEGVAKGDINQVLNGAMAGATSGTMTWDKSGGGLFNAQDTVGSIVGGLTGTTALKDSINNAQAAQVAQEKAAADALAKQQEDAKAAAISRRRADLSGDTQTIYTSALGDVANTAIGKIKKKTVLGG